MFGWQRFSEDARHTILLAQNKAVSVGQTVVGTEHLLFGLVQEGTVPQLLQQSKVSLDQLKSQLEQVIVSQSDTTLKIVGKEAKLTSGAKRVLELAAEEARSIKTPTNAVEPEHILLGLLRLKEDLPASYTLLTNFGLKLEEVRLQVRIAQAANRKAA